MPQEGWPAVDPETGEPRLAMPLEGWSPVDPDTGELRPGAAVRQFPGGPMGERPAGAGFGGSRPNELVSRCHANPEFEALYEQALTSLTESLYASGLADQVLADWVQLLQSNATDLVDASTLNSEAATIAESIARRS
jgi:spore coat protein CotH